MRISCNSPICVGKSPAKSVDPTTGVYQCFRCKDSGRDISLITKPKVKREEKEFEEPPKSHDLSIREIEYLTGRGLTPRIIAQAKPRRTSKGILFPFPGFPKYWQERRWSNFNPPWKNPGTTKGGVVYLFEKDSDRKDLVVVEGILDALSVGTYCNSAAILGKAITDKQAYYISTRCKKAKVLLDADTSVQERALVLRKLSNFVPVQLLTLREGDPNDALLSGELKDVLRLDK